MPGPGRRCSAHGGGYQCQSLKCKNRAVSGGPRPYVFCYRHNGGIACAVQGCTTAAKVRGLCGRHGNKRCSHPGCTTATQAHGLCNRHGGGYGCIIPGCTTNVYRNNRCRRHKLSPTQTDPRPSNPYEAGTSQAVSSDTPRPRQRPTTPCTAPGCNSTSKARGLCGTHSSKRCSEPGCTTAARCNSLFVRHGGGRCIVLGCTSCARRGGRCDRHRYVTGSARVRPIPTASGPSSPPTHPRSAETSPRLRFPSSLATGNRRREMSPQ